MKKKQLETLLEQGFEKLGFQLGERVYWEDISTAAAVDDVLGETTVDKAREEFKKEKKGLELNISHTNLILNFMKVLRKEKQCLLICLE